jgi:hypothetical protein
LEDRVREAAESALAEQGYVSNIDVLMRGGYMAPALVGDPRRGRSACLEELILVNPSKIESTIFLFRNWACQRNVQPSEAADLIPTRGSPRPLQFTKSGAYLPAGPGLNFPAFLADINYS